MSTLGIVLTCNRGPGIGGHAEELGSCLGEITLLFPCDDKILAAIDSNRSPEEVMPRGCGGVALAASSYPYVFPAPLQVSSSGIIIVIIILGRVPGDIVG